MTLTCTLDVDYVNPADQAPSGGALPPLPQRLLRGELGPLRLLGAGHGLPRGLLPGGIRIERLAVDGQAVDPAISRRAAGPADRGPARAPWTWAAGRASRWTTA